MDLKLQGKVAIVTGASKGIGAGIAKALAAEGVAVAVNYATSKEGADRVVSSILENGGKAVAIQADVSKAQEVKRLFKETKAAFGGVNLVVNNAAAFKFNPIEAITEEEFQREFTTNVLGPILTTQEAIHYFPEAGGNIINIGSAVSKKPGTNNSLYGATKGALDTLTEAFALELAPRNIRVNMVAPSMTETEGTHSLGLFGTELEEKIIAATPLGRVGQPVDIAKVVVFLASDASGWITGDRIRADGGMH